MSDISDAMPGKTPRTASRRAAGDKRREPSQERSRERIAAVKAAACAALVEAGYSRMTMLDIAARAGVKHSSIYAYFGSVDAILEALFRDLLAEGNEQGERLLRQARTQQDVVEACFAFWRAALETYRDEPAARALYAAARNVPALAAMERQDYREVVDFILAAFRRVAPWLDRRALRPSIVALVHLAIPMYGLILEQPAGQRRTMQAQLEDMLRLQLGKTLSRQA